MGLASCAPCIASTSTGWPVWSIDRTSVVRAPGICSSGRPRVWSLAAPPRTLANVEGTVANLRRAEKIVGPGRTSKTLRRCSIRGSTLGESDWTRRILDVAQCKLLFDLHNVFANGLNHGYEPTEFLRNWCGTGPVYAYCRRKMITAPDGTSRLLDDHLHDVPDPYTTYWKSGCDCDSSAHGDLERGRRFPVNGNTVQQARRARSAMARGRARNRERVETAA